MTEKYIGIFEDIPYPTWKRLNLPEDLFGSMERESAFLEHSEGISVEEISSDSFDEIDTIDLRFEKGLGDKFTYFSKAYAGVSFIIKVKNTGKNESLKINANKPDYVSNLLIKVDKNAQVTITIDHKSEAFSTHHGITRIIADEYSKVKLIKLQRLSGDSRFFDQNIMIGESNSEIKVYDLQYGANKTAVSYESHLDGYRAECDIKSAYLGIGSDVMDLSYTAIHKGKQSTSSIIGRGVLKDNTQKTFRGNLFFRKGSKGSQGNEEEYVVLLDKSVKADSIPALFSDEDDVVGNHAASAGKLSEDALFYVMSRGLSESEAKALITISSFREIVDQIDDANVQDAIMADIERRVANEIKKA